MNVFLEKLVFRMQYPLFKAVSDYVKVIPVYLTQRVVKGGCGLKMVPLLADKRLM